MKADEERRHRSAEETAAFGKLNMETLSAGDTRLLWMTRFQGSSDNKAYKLKIIKFDPEFLNPRAEPKEMPSQFYLYPNKLKVPIKLDEIECKSINFTPNPSDF